MFNSKAAVLAVSTLCASALYAGDITGPNPGHEDVVGSYSNDIYNITFRGGALAMVGISGDGDTDLDLHIYDENGNEVCRSVGAYDDEFCSFTPRWTGRFRVQVSNLGNVWNRYTLVTN